MPGPKFADNRGFCPDDIEDIRATLIRVDFVEQGRSLTRVTLQPLILALVHDLIAERVVDCSFLDLKCPAVSPRASYR
jgi:hypothetical protein